MIYKLFIKNCEHFAKEYIYAFENHLITNTTDEDQTNYLYNIAKVIYAACPNQEVLNDATKGDK
jgi:hypothetical protein